MKLQFTWNQLLKIEGIEQLDKSNIALNGVCYEKCIKCKGSGNVAWGKCYDCNGWGIYGTETIEKRNKRLEEIKINHENYLKSDAYKMDQLQELYMTLVKRLEENDIVNDWESNFANSLYCKQFNEISPKQKTMLKKLSDKVHTVDDKEQFKQFVE